MISVAIDGPAGAGKSSVAKAAAEKLGFVYVDTGALYRSVALYLLDYGVDLADSAAVEAALPGVQIDLEYAPSGQRMFLCGEDVTGRIRTAEVSRATPKCAAIPAVREFLLGLQRELARKNNVLMDGRDIGTVVLPEAQLKVFLTASPEERARRRVLQMQKAGETADFQEILRDIEQRDYEDTHRAAAPLKRAEGARVLDTSEMTFEQSVDTLVAWVKECGDRK